MRRLKIVKRNIDRYLNFSKSFTIEEKEKIINYLKELKLNHQYLNITRHHKHIHLIIISSKSGKEITTFYLNEIKI